MAVLPCSVGGTCRGTAAISRWDLEARPWHSSHCRQCCPGSHGVSRPTARRNLRTRRLPSPRLLRNPEVWSSMPRLNHQCCLLPLARTSPCMSRSCWMLWACSPLAHGVPGTHIPLSAGGGPPLSPTMLARPFLPVPELAYAVEHVSQSFHPSSLHLSPSLRRFQEWAALRQAQVTSLAELVRAIADPRDAHIWALPRRR